jgi:DNA-binding beta-propeller fold protein YncE
MLKIGDRMVTTKDLILVGVLILVAIAAIWAMVGSKPKPVIGMPGTGMVLMQGGQPGSGLGQFSYPRGIAVNNKGEVYVADSKNHRVQRFNGKDWQLMSDFGGFANVGGGDVKKLVADSPGKLNEPNGLSIGPDDNVYVIDTWNGRVQTFTSRGSHKQTFAVDDGFFGPREIVTDANGFFYVADTGKHRIVKFDSKGQKVRVWGNKGDKPGEFNEPIGLALDQAGNLYVADRLNFRIQVFNADGIFVKQWAVKGWSKEQIDMEPHLALDQIKGLLYATDGRGKAVYCYKLDGTLVSTIAKDAQGNNLFSVPLGIAVDKEGNVYVTDAGAGKIYKIKGQ